jgi:uncharacterized membrane protein
LRASGEEQWDCAPHAGYAVRVNQTELTGQVDSAIESIAELERKALASASLQQRAIERFTRAVGRPRTIAYVLLFVFAWIAANGILVASGRPAFDGPPFPWLIGALQLAALLMTVVILTTENRMSEIEEARSRLHLQISILAERKTAKIVQLLEELRYDMPSVPNREDREAQEMTLATNPHQVARELEKRTPARGDEVPE